MSPFSYSAKLYESDLQKGEICYEKAKKEHFDALFALYECSFPDKAPRLPFEYGVINELDTYIALIDGTPVGMVSANPVFYKGQKGHQIFKLCAHPKVRGRGIGGALLSFMHRERRAEGDLFSLVMPGSEGLYSFYEKQGYASISAKRIILTSRESLLYEDERVEYLPRYEALCLESAAKNQKTVLSGYGSYCGFEEEGRVFLDDLMPFGRRIAPVCPLPVTFYLPDPEGKERYGMVCALDARTDLEGIYPRIVMGFHK